MASYEPKTRGDGKQILGVALRCRWCFAVMPADAESSKPAGWPHARPCRVEDLVEQWAREGNTAAVVREYDDIIATLDAADERRPD